MVDLLSRASDDDLPGIIAWFKRVPPGWVDAYRIVGWVIEPVAPSHHDAHCVIMRYGGTLAAEANPPIPKTSLPVMRKTYPTLMRRLGR